MNASDYMLVLREASDYSVDNLHNLSRWALEQALPWLQHELAGIIGANRARLMSPHHAIRCGLRTTPVDRDAMPLNKQFYRAQLTMLDSEARRYCHSATLLYDSPAPSALEARVYQVQSRLSNLLWDGISMLEQAAGHLIQVPTAYSVWRSNFEAHYEIFKSAEQLVYGEFSGLANADLAPFAPIAVLRTAIESRIRSAFCIYAYEDTTTRSVHPIDMKRLFQEVANHASTIEFVVDMHDVYRIYRWSNPYLHAGWRDYSWVPGFCVQFLKPLFTEPWQTPQGGLSINGGIKMPRDVWNAVRNAFQTRAKTGQRLNPADLANAKCVFIGPAS
jgi:hypothetical protein